MCWACRPSPPNAIGQRLAFGFIGGYLALVQALKAVELDPNNSTILHDLAKIHVELGQDEKALEAVNKALEFHPNPMNSGLFYLYNTRAGIYARKEMFATALADYDKSLELAPYRSYT